MNNGAAIRDKLTARVDAVLQRAHPAIRTPPTATHVGPSLSEAGAHAFTIMKLMDHSTITISQRLRASIS